MPGARRSSVAPTHGIRTTCFSHTRRVPLATGVRVKRRWPPCHASCIWLVSGVRARRCATCTDRLTVRGTHLVAARSICRGVLHVYTLGLLVHSKCANNKLTVLPPVHTCTDSSRPCREGQQCVTPLTPGASGRINSTRIGMRKNLGIAAVAPQGADLIMGACALCLLVYVLLRRMVYCWTFRASCDPRTCAAP